MNPMRALLGVGVLSGILAACSGESAPAAGTGSGGGALVLACQSAASHFATLCAGSDPRPCYWNAYAKLCATGRTQLLVDSMKCLDNTTCRTFSDPNEAASCLAQLHAADESASAKTAIENACSSCGGSSCSTITGTAEILPYLADADLATLVSCASAGCAGLAPACASDEALAPFVACGP
jgi:hypothetical protein